jgi:hypothetical protein
MATTYSLSATGYAAGSVLGPKVFDIPDLSLAGIQTGVAGGQANAMSDGDLMLVKGPDGGLHWYRLDAERSTAANPVLIFVGP